VGVIPAHITLIVDWPQIRHAERVALGTGHRKLTPVGLALTEQTRFCRGEFTDAGIVLYDGLTLVPVTYDHNPELKAYLERWALGLPVQPERFELTVRVEA